jgi:hypothetical protein
MQDLIPLERRWLELLHMTLNVGNTWLKVARQALHFLLLPDGTPRNRADLDPNHRVSANPLPPSPGKAKSFGKQGFDIIGAIYQELRIKEPLTDYHGGQLDRVFSQKGLDKLFGNPKLARGLELLAMDPEVAPITASLKAVFHAIADLRSLVNHWDPDMAAVESAVASFTEHAAKLATADILAPCRYRWRLYCHAIAHHLLPQMRALHQVGLSLAQVSSRALRGQQPLCQAVFAPYARWWL